MKRLLFLLLLVGASQTSWAAPKTPPVTRPATSLDPLRSKRGVIARRAFSLGRWETQELRGKLGEATATGRVLVYLPAGYDPAAARKAPLVLALHGWNHTPEQLRDKADLEILADRYGLVLALPAMGKSVYESALYPQTRQAWGAVAGARWVGEVVLPRVRELYAVAADREHTAVIGYSTGGRGALLLAQTYAEVAFAGSLSGTFDLTRLSATDGEYKIHAAVYGPRRKFAERWQRDNVVEPGRVSRLASLSLFLGHGGRDRVVAQDQLSALVDELEAQGLLGAKVHVVRTPEGAHDWAYWNSQWPAMFEAMAQTFAAGELPAKPARRPKVARPR